MQKDIKITIKLEPIESFMVQLNIDEEAFARRAQQLINGIYNSWKEKFPYLDEKQLLGRIAFLLARKYEEQKNLLDNMEQAIEECENRLDNLLLSSVTTPE